MEIHRCFDRNAKLSVLTGIWLYNDSAVTDEVLLGRIHLLQTTDVKHLQQVWKFALSPSHQTLVRFPSIKTSPCGSAPLINVSDGLAAGELCSHLSVATINTYFMTNYIHNLTRIDGAGDRSACGALQHLQRRYI